MEASASEDCLQTEHGESLVVGIGASAGGVEALEGFFSHLPAGEIDAARVVITRLARHRKSLLAEVIRRHMPLKVAIQTALEELKSGNGARLCE